MGLGKLRDAFTPYTICISSCMAAIKMRFASKLLAVCMLNRDLLNA